MRLLPIGIAAVGLLVVSVRGQYRNGLGIMDSLAPPSWPLAVAKPPVLGGNCCGFGQNCATDTVGKGICIGVSSPTSSTSTTAASTSSVLPTGAVIEHNSAGLSTGAKAGIAVGVILVAALVIGALTYLCLRRRRNGARSETTTAQELPSMPPAGGAAAVAVPHGPHMSEADGDALSYDYAPSSTGLSRGGNGPAQVDYFGEEGIGTRGTPHQPKEQYRYPHAPDNVVAPVEIGTRHSLRGRPPVAHARMDSQGSEADGSQSELADTSRGPSPAFGYSGGGPASPVESIAGRFELYGDFGTATAASGKEEFHDAQESLGGNRSRGAVVGGSGTLLPQPFPTPGSEMSEFATPSPMSREEEAQFRK
ncbi:hypothetical protein N0V82_009961 [Gnomoniopsis sp. IMI 355080]|nr:hypothetical protein N0V82_009961 [Gnomoniopsis sp. IMI 355080]